MSDTMRGVLLPGGRQVETRTFPVPEPGYRQVLVAMKASSICGSDIRAIYREHLGHGPEAYQNVIAGHEPCGQIVATGPGCRRFAVGDRVVIYHISGCGVCADCREGYMISCTSPVRAAYGWQRDGGHADFLLADESTCVALPDALSYVDGALVACGFGTAYEALTRIGLSGRDALLITGLGPVGLAAAQLGRALGAGPIIGADVTPARLELARTLGLVDHALPAGAQAVEQVRAFTGGHGCQASIDCSGSPAGRMLALGGTRRWGRCAFVGEGNRIDFDVSQTLIHNQITLYGSWVTSVGRMEELVDRLAAWGLHPEVTASHLLPLEAAADAYAIADAGQSGKVCLVMG